MRDARATLDMPASRAAHAPAGRGSAHPAARYYRPELDVLRFIAFMFVFMTHRTDLAPIDPARHPWWHAFAQIGVYGVPAPARTRR